MTRTSGLVACRRTEGVEPARRCQEDVLPDDVVAGELSDEDFRAKLQTWLAANLVGEFAELRGVGGPGDEHTAFDARHRWERALADGGWTCVGWPAKWGGRDATISQQVLFNEELAKAGAPHRVGLIGEGMTGPTLLAFGTPEQQQRWLPGIRSGTELWCQGYSEPNAGSDLANVQTRAVRDGDEWVITGQKVWTSLAFWADWCFVVCRTDPEAPKHKGLSYIMVPMDAPGIEIRPIVQITGTSEFAEVFFDEVRVPADFMIGAPGDGWRIALATLAFERGTFTLGQQIGFQAEWDEIAHLAKVNGASRRPAIRQRLVDLYMRVRIMRVNNLRALESLKAGQEPGPESSIGKLFWSHWHRDLGELAMDVLGADSMLADAAPYELTKTQKLFMFTRSDTIYAGSSEIQRNIIGEHALGLPKEPR
ncbi:MAG: acyl-CoA dehydrogenase family protein [Acidimicrobiia bacterium]|jgi:alkylation response protein AidB-like acyl-CoA dehydrogenase|nr:acyl-CoA dehydrogenase family protein [Acidimicrobiia bacterium]